MKYVELAGVFFKDLREVELLNRSPTVVGRVQADVRGRRRRGISCWRLDIEEPVCRRGTSLWRPQAKVDLEQAVQF